MKEKDILDEILFRLLKCNDEMMLKIEDFDTKMDEIRDEIIAEINVLK